MADFLVIAKVAISKEVFEVMTIKDVPSSDEAVRKARHYGKNRLQMISAMTTGKELTLEARKVE
jgi:hypothetical protein